MESTTIEKKSSLSSPLKPLTFAIVAGEHSGDNHGAQIIQSLKKNYPNAAFVGVGGAKMQAAGLKSLMPMEILSIIGIVAVIKNIFKLLSAKRQLVKDILSFQPDCYIGIDAPDFNLRIARKIKDYSVKNNLNIQTVQYISPTVWAWRPKRIYTVAKATDMVLCIFPFEEKIYNDQNIPAKFVGHPLTEELHPRAAVEQERVLQKLAHLENSKIQLQAAQYRKIIAILPGSRMSEVDSLSPVFLKTMLNLSEHDSQLQFVVPLVNHKLYQLWVKHFAELPQHQLLDSRITLIKLYDNDHVSSVDVMRAADLILCASGTTTIEALLLNVPMVVAYKISKLNAWIIKKLIKVKYIAMPNILADKLFGFKLVPEFLQEDVTAENLTATVLQELSKYPQLQTNNHWHDLQQYLQAGNIDHQSAVTQAIQEILNK